MSSRHITDTSSHHIPTCHVTLRHIISRPLKSVYNDITNISTLQAGPPQVSSHPVTSHHVTNVSFTSHCIVHRHTGPHPLTQYHITRHRIASHHFTQQTIAHIISSQVRQVNQCQARFRRRISAVSNAIETIDNEMICFIIFCLNYIRYGRNATYEPGLIQLQETKVQRYLNFNSWFGFIQGSLKDYGKGFINNLFDISSCMMYCQDKRLWNIARPRASHGATRTD